MLEQQVSISLLFSPSAPFSIFAQYLFHSIFIKDWIAPEIFAGNGVYTSAVDGLHFFIYFSLECTNKTAVFSFGIILWEILTEKQPYADTPHQSFDIPLLVVRGLRPSITDEFVFFWQLSPSRMCF